MTAEAAVVLAAAEMLDVQFCRRMIDDFGNDAGAFDERPAYECVFAFLTEKHPLKLEFGPDFRVAVIQAHHVAFLHPILPRSVFEHRVHCTVLGKKALERTNHQNSVTERNRLGLMLVRSSVCPFNAPDSQDGTSFVLERLDDLKSCCAAGREECRGR